MNIPNLAEMFRLLFAKRFPATLHKDDHHNRPKLAAMQTKNAISNILYRTYWESASA